MEEEKKEYPKLVQGLLIVMILYGLYRSLSKFIGALTYGDITPSVVSLGCEILNIVFLLFILQKKAWGMWAFFGMLLLQIPVNLLFGNNNIVPVVVSAVGRIAIMCLIFFIKQDDVSGWDVLLGDKAITISERLKHFFIEDDEEKDISVVDSTKGIQLEDISGTKERDIIASPQSVNVGEVQREKPINVIHESDSDKGKKEGVLIEEKTPSKRGGLIGLLPFRVIVGYVVWVFINLILLVISLIQGGFKYHPFYPSLGYSWGEESSISVFFPFPKQMNQCMAKALDIACYDWSEFLIYTLLPLLCIIVVALIVKTYKKQNNEE